MIEAGYGGDRVWLIQHEIGEDLIYHLGGGQRPHIGGVVMKVPGEPPKTQTFGTHHDLEVLTPIAEAACERYGSTVVVVGGVHVDDATPEDIESLVSNCERLLGQL